MADAQTEKIIEIVDRMVTNFCAKIVEDAQMNVVTNKTVDSGYLKANIRFRKIAPLKYIIESTAPYSAYVEYGTKAHVIVPREKKALAFARPGGRRVVRKGKVMTEFKFGGKKALYEAIIVKKVHHPGTTAKPFLEPAVKLNIQRLKEGKFLES